MRRRVVVSFLGVLLAVLLAATAAQSRGNAGSPITIAWIGDMSGPTVGAQLPVLHGIQTYVKMINDKGGVKGHPINLLAMDDGYQPAKELELVKTAINDDHAVLITGIGNSSGFASILPVLNSAHVAGLSNQGTLKSNSWPFQPWIFEGNCNYADQGDVAIAFEMKHLKLKSLKGVKVGVAGIAVASGQEWIQNVSEAVQKLGGTAVQETLPAAIVNADVQVQAFQNAGVKFILMHHATTGGIAMLRSMSKFGLDVPISGSFGVTQNVVFQTAPYDAVKNFVGTNCFTPPLLAKTKVGKLAAATGKKYGVSASDIEQPNFALGWVNAQMIVEGLKNVKGAYTGLSVRNGLQHVKNLDTGGLAPNVTLSARCHMAIRSVRPYYYSFPKKTMEPVGTYALWAKYIRNAYAAPGTCGKPRGATG